MAFDIDMIKDVYDSMGNRIDAAKTLLGKPMTLAEKILHAHLFNG